jgi:hypothetical protein
MKHFRVFREGEGIFPGMFVVVFCFFLTQLLHKVLTFYLLNKLHSSFFHLGTVNEGCDYILQWRLIRHATVY